MMPMNGGSLFGGLVGLVVVVALLAVVAGIALSGNDLLNPRTSDAIAREKNQATQTKSEKDKIDLAAYQAEKDAETEKTNLELENYKTIQAARTQAEQDKARLEVEAKKQELAQALAHQQARAELDIALARLTRYVMLAAGTLAILVASIGLTTCLIRFSRSRWAPAQAKVAHTSVSSDPGRRTEQISWARANEIAERKIMLAYQATAQKPTISGNGKNPPEVEKDAMKGVV